MSETTNVPAETDKLTWWQRVLGLNPVVIAAAISGVCGLLAAVGLSAAADVDATGVSEGIVLLFGLAGSVLARLRVTPNQKVVAYLPDPKDATIIAPGEATVAAADLEAVEVAALATPKTEDAVYAFVAQASEGDVVDEDPFDGDFPSEAQVSGSHLLDEKDVYETHDQLAMPGRDFDASGFAPVGEDQVDK